MIKPIFLLSATILLGMTTITQAQTPVPTAHFATWKDNRTAAYTIVHDDFGDVTTFGITQYADTIAHQRGVKFVFGAITSSCDTQDWKDSKRLITHGHEIINHSHSHRCAVNTGWCTNVYGPADYHLELDTSTAWIERGSGHRPRFFIHPYDLYTDSIINHLKFLKYLGARSGQYSQMNKPTFTDFFRLNFFVFDPVSTLAQMNETVDAVISDGSYAVRELHGVEDWSWGKVTLADYKAHLDYIKTKMDLKQLWTATFSEVITYKMQRDVFNPITKFDYASNLLTVRFDTLKTLDTTVLKTPVTVNIVLDGIQHDSNLVVMQNGVRIEDVRYGKDSIFVNVYPHRGSLEIVGKWRSCEPNCPPPPCKPNGQLLNAIWDSIALHHWQMRDLTENARFPNQPTRIDTLKNTSYFVDDHGDTYGEKTYGYLIPKETGDYVFTITGDDDCELYLSLNAAPISKRKVAGFNGFTGPTEFTKFTGQLSAPIHLDSGSYYYVELLHLATVGHNPFRVYWQTPSNNQRTLIDKRFLASKTCIDTVAHHLNKVEQPLYLTGFLNKNQIVLDWVTKSDLEHFHFIIEKQSLNGTFELLDMLHSKHHHPKRNWFRYKDGHPTNAQNIYRIRLMYSDGTSKVSNSITINIDDLGLFRVFPNPAHQYSHVSMDLTPWIGEDVTVLIYNSTGQLLKQLNINEVAKTPYDLEINPNWNSGQYLIRVYAADGREKVQKLTIFRE
jgi:peptidoglycan/xylan/chitin deacetylase (PgdA/CDA1 family)